MVAHVIFHKFGNFVYAGDYKQFIMFCVLECHPLNLVYFIIQRMMACARKTNSPMPYNSLVTIILEYYNVNSFDDKIISPKEIGANNMIYLGYITYMNDWVLKKLPARKRTHHSDSEEENPKFTNQLVPMDTRSQNSKVLAILQECASPRSFLQYT